MKLKYKVAVGTGAAAFLIGLTTWYLQRHTIAVLQPAGIIGTKERDLIIFCAAISAVIVVPVFGLLISFAWKYRESNKKAKYTPQLGGSKGAELIWWLVPSAIIAVIAVVTWQSSYALDPYKPIGPAANTLHVQVVALDWKWLFIYPNQHIASVNELTLPQNTPVDFEITSDSVMNSFWIPQLGGQMYAMPGMTTQLNLEADKIGAYHGQSANISGRGFADMTFTATVLGRDIYANWVKTMQHTPTQLAQINYGSLAKPGTITTSSNYRYGSVQNGLFDSILMKYMMPMNTGSNMSGMRM